MGRLFVEPDSDEGDLRLQEIIGGPSQALPNAERPDRQERVSIPFWTTKAAKKQLKILAAEEECTQQVLLTQALNLLFRSRSMTPLA